MSSPTTRSLEYLRRLGFEADIAEKRNWFAGPPHMKCASCGKNRIGLTQDLFGIIDIVAVHPAEPGVLFVQTTTTGNRSARLKKILASPRTRALLLSQNRVVVHGWAKKGAEGKRKLWTLDPLPIELHMLPESDGKAA